MIWIVSFGESSTRPSCIALLKVCLKKISKWFLYPRSKKGNNIRVVFDCASKFDDVSLNDVIYQGPDNIASLFGVLLRFRKGKYAAIGDITEMYHRVLNTEQDKSYFKFLWYPNGDTTMPSLEYQMNVHIFGCIF